jgi:hypothetical protein
MVEIIVRNPTPPCAGTVGVKFKDARLINKKAAIRKMFRIARLVKPVWRSWERGTDLSLCVDFGLIIDDLS